MTEQHVAARGSAEPLADRVRELEAEVDRLAARPDPDVLARRVADLEALVARLTGSATGDLRAAGEAPTTHGRTPMAGSTADAPGDAMHGRPHDAADGRPGPTTVDRRRLIGRAGTAVLGAAVGGAAMVLADASPAAAVTGSFDSAAAGTPALTATNTGGGSAIRATGVSGASAATVVVEATQGTALRIASADISPAVTVSHTGPGIVSLGVEAPEVSTAIYGVGEIHGVLGRSSGSIGGFGIAGESVEGIAGVGGTGQGKAAGGAFASYSSIGVLAVGAQAQLSLRGPSVDIPMAPPRSTSIAHIAGEIYLDDAQSLWLCTAAGTPGTWVRITGAGTAGPLSMLPAPVRVYDTRPGAAPTGVGPKTPHATAVPRTGIALTANGSTVPTDATAAIVSITVTNTTGGSPAGPAYLGIYANGASYAGTSNLNWTAPSSTIAVTTTTAVGPGATIAAFASHPTDLIIDVIAYHR
jgi:hypothetical protein